MKKFYFFLGVLIVASVLGVVVGVFKMLNPSTLNAENCPFCLKETLEAQVFYESETVYAMLTYKPIVPGHMLIIPKRHVERFEELTDQEMLSIGQTIKKVNQAISKVFATGPYLLHQKNGKEVGQTVPHIHIHYVPLKAEKESLGTLAWAALLAQMKPALTAQEMSPLREKLKKAMEE